MDNQNLENLDEKTFNILEHIKDNLSGFILLLFAFFIIYFVDCINRLNLTLYSNSSPIPGLTSIVNTARNISKRKLRNVNFI